MAEHDSICIALYFSETRVFDWAERFLTFSRRYAERVNEPLTELAFTTYDHHYSGDAKLYNPVSVEELMPELKRGYVMSLTVRATGSSLPNEPYLLSLSVNDYRRSRGYGLIYLQMALELIPETSHTADLAQAILQTMDASFTIRYGIVERMPASALPEAYFTVCSMRATSADHDRDMMEWDAKSPYFQNTTRGIFWGNLISSGHWQHHDGKRDELLTDLRIEAGMAGFTFGESGLFYHMPNDLAHRQCPDERESYRRAAERVLARYGVSTMFDFEPDEHTQIVDFRPPFIDRSDLQETNIPAPTTTPSPMHAIARLRRDAIPATENPDGDAPIYPVVTLEEFFDGNEDDGSIGLNLQPHPGIVTFQRVLSTIRQRGDVDDVVVQIADLLDDDAPNIWPLFAEWVYIITSVTIDDVDEWIFELKPDAIREGLPHGVPPGMPTIASDATVYSVWWD